MFFAIASVLTKTTLHNAFLGAPPSSGSLGHRGCGRGVSRWTLAVDGQRRTMLIARLDRFSRRVSFIARIMDEGISLCCAEMPNASEFQLHIFAALAQEERRLISERTRAALAEAKKRGRRLGANGAKLALINKQQADGFAGSD